MTLTPEQEEFRQQWIAALRSGKYQQGPKFLKTDEQKYCCLGVACELVPPSVGTFEPEASRNRYGESPKTFTFVPTMDACRDGLPPKEVADFMGINAQVFAMLASLNDKGFSFDAIAFLLETKWDQLQSPSWNFKMDYIEYLTTNGFTPTPFYATTHL